VKWRGTTVRKDGFARVARSNGAGGWGEEKPKRRSGDRQPCLQEEPEISGFPTESVGPPDGGAARRYKSEEESGGSLIRGQRILLGMGAEHAEDHGDLSGMVDGVVDDAVEHGFVGIGAAGDLFGQVCHRKGAKPFFEQVAALVPTGE
jgi:hypothetical protein